MLSHALPFIAVSFFAILLLCISSLPLYVNSFLYSGSPAIGMASIQRRSLRLLRTFQWDNLKTAASGKMAKSADSVASTFATIQATSADNSIILDRLMVSTDAGEKNGGKAPLERLARVVSPKPNIILVEPFTKDPTVLVNIEKAIKARDSALSCTRSSNDKLEVIIPSLTKERREQLIKQAKESIERGKVSVRNARRDAIESIKRAEKAKDISKNDSKNHQSDIQAAHDSYIKRIESLWKSKQQALERI